VTFEQLGEGSRRADRRMGYVTHRHWCNPWCRLSLHAGLTYSRRPDDISDVIRADYEATGYRVLEVRRATELPPDDPRLMLRRYPWLVFFERNQADPSDDAAPCSQLSGPDAGNTHTITAPATNIG
jgi:hypothetical protein